MNGELLQARMGFSNEQLCHLSERSLPSLTKAWLTLLPAQWGQDFPLSNGR